MKKILFLIFTAFILYSCSTTYRVTQKVSPDDFIGWSHKYIVEALGAPTSQTSDGADGYILVYEGCKEVFKYDSGYVKAAGVAPTLQLYMTSDGVCRRTLTTHTESARSFSPGKTIGLLLLLKR